ncbi:hypothetical protein [Mucisphaera calidilacus]|uniref:hypothetical protein n=1 Tax=Mucisphaera calidilacus TaxID=2527982 RepID=UPI0011A17B3A|nr:hypothetical protein [Mucisphaera calidilacus]
MPARVLAVCFALVGFTGSALVGLIAGNDPSTILIRSIFVMFGCWLVGRLCGAVSMVSVREYLSQHQEDHPMPGDVENTSPSRDDNSDVTVEPA